MLTTPFGTLLHFRKDVDTPQPRMLRGGAAVGPLRHPAARHDDTLLADHDVYVTDWHNLRDVPLAAGAFAFDDYIDHVIRFLEAIGPGAHVLAVCQPCVQVLAAAAIMAADGNPAQPRSMTLMAGPVDTRISPTKVNELATGKPIAWFEQHLIATVPMRYKGAGRKVYPGFVQLLAFMSMNLERHKKAHRDLHDHLVKGEIEQAETIKTFYDEYLAVLDLSADFYLETVRYVFQDALLAKGELEFRGRRVDPAAIRRTALLTVEGERDDICALGQTVAAHDLCTGLRPYMKRHHCRPASAITASSAAGAGRPRSTRSCATSCSRPSNILRRRCTACSVRVSNRSRPERGRWPELQHGLAGARRLQPVAAPDQPHHRVLHQLFEPRLAGGAEAPIAARPLPW